MSAALVVDGAVRPPAAAQVDSGIAYRLRYAAAGEASVRVEIAWMPPLAADGVLVMPRAILMGYGEQRYDRGASDAGWAMTSRTKRSFHRRFERVDERLPSRIVTVVVAARACYCMNSHVRERVERAAAPHRASAYRPDAASACVASRQVAAGAVVPPAESHSARGEFLMNEARVVCQQTVSVEVGRIVRIGPFTDGINLHAILLRVSAL